MNYPETKINQLVPGMRNINVTFIVLDVGSSKRTSQGHDVRTIKVADASGSILMSVWNELGDYFVISDIWRLRNGYTSVFKGCLMLSAGKVGDLVKVGEFFMAILEHPNMSEYSPELAAKYPSSLRKASPDEEGMTGASNQSGLSNLQGVRSIQNAPKIVKRSSSSSTQGHQPRRLDLMPTKNPRIN